MGKIDTQTVGKQLNELFILAMLRGGPKHGYQLAMEAEERSGGDLTLQHGTLYPILYRLEKQGEVRGRWARASGRRRKVYDLTHAGASRLRQETGELRHTFDRILNMLGRAHEPLRGGPATR
jgi:PadR family transcriptional regulator, regulatory protein PadR